MSNARTVLHGPELADLELVLAGVLPSGHLLGGPVAASSGVEPPAPRRPIVRVRVTDDAAAAAAVEGRLDLVDLELTPLAVLEDLVVADGVVTGAAVRGRVRESGAGRGHAWTDADRTAGWGTVLLLGRPLLSGETLGTGVNAILVPDIDDSTAGVPTHVVVAIAERLSAGTVPVRTVPVAWRDVVSDAALLQRLSRWLGGATILVRSDHPHLDPAAMGWRGLSMALSAGAADLQLDVHPEDAARLLAWRPPRSRRGLVVFFTGLSGSGKSTVARALAADLRDQGARTVSLLDGDLVRHLLSAGLGFDRESRNLNIRRIGFVAAEVARHGGVAICAPIAPYAQVRAEVRAMAEEVGDFVLVHVSTPLEECERRDLKGLYAKARAGLIPEFTGVSDPYEEPTDAELAVDTSTMTTAAALAVVRSALERGGWVPPRSQS